jgi:hypothetical protein
MTRLKLSSILLGTGVAAVTTLTMRRTMTHE